MGIDVRFNPKYDLRDARKRRALKEPAAHQHAALQDLHRWYEKPHSPRGGLLVLPTGGGKTFVAMRFLCSAPLSKGCRVLWLAHTHHLLEQAHDAIKDSVGHVSEPKDHLSTRVVSGTEGHYRVQDISPDDDVVFATLQTITGALKSNQPSLLRFLDAAGGKLFVIFDEAHHAPAATYRRFIEDLRARFPGMGLLGLTATPTYTGERKRGWLDVLFPQWIIHQITAEKLMLAGVLARPNFEEVQTRVKATFDERVYQRWSTTNRDLPEDVVDLLARNDDRNHRIVDTYVHNQEKFGRTIMFADRVFQCEALAELLRLRGVRAGVMFSDSNRGPATAEARRRRMKDENARELEKFKKGELDVLVNVRMLTEGTDVPSARTVFLTRQTTSRILMTQMIGRALRGPLFGGTKEAHIVLFIDDWKHLINFAAWDRLSGGFDDTGKEVVERPPVYLVSVDLVRDLVRQMDTGVNVAPAPFLSMLPVGWYIVEYAARIADSTDTESVHRPVLVYDTAESCYGRLVEELMTSDLRSFEDSDLYDAATEPAVNGWLVRFFGDGDGHIGENLGRDVLAVARHIAQNGTRPRFFPFEERSCHDLEKLAKQAIGEDWGPTAIMGALQGEYNRVDRFWSTLYHSLTLFKGQFDATLNRLLLPPPKPPDPISPPPPPDPEVSEAIRKQVLKRDQYRCVACGNDSKRSLQIDHIVARYFEGSNEPENLQTLCRTCNQLKSTDEISFRNLHTDLQTAPTELTLLKLPPSKVAGKPLEWERYLRRVINWFFQCGAVHSVDIGQRVSKFYKWEEGNWEVELRSGNNPQWLKPHLFALRKAIFERRAEVRQIGPRSITVTSPGAETCKG